MSYVVSSDSIITRLIITFSYWKTKLNYVFQVLLAPAGLIRHHHFDCQSRLMYSGILPESLLQWIIRRRLSGSIGGNDKKLQPAEAAITEEIKGARDHDFESHPLSKSHPDITVGSAIQWQVQNHEGFLTSFISSIKYASIEGKHEVWRKLGLRSDKALIFAGTKDPLV